MAKRILVVDDDPDLRDAAEMILTPAGYEVVHAESRKEAEDKLRSEPIDLILLDVMMETDTAGFHLAYDLRNDEKLKNIPIVILTCTEAKTGVEIEPETAGDYLPVDAFFRKPLEADSLKAKIAELLG